MRDEVREVEPWLVEEAKTFAHKRLDALLDETHQLITIPTIAKKVKQRTASSSFIIPPS